MLFLGLRREEEKEERMPVGLAGWGFKVKRAEKSELHKKLQALIFNKKVFLNKFQPSTTCTPDQTFRNFVCLLTKFPLNEHHNICAHICKNDTLFA